MLVKVFVLGRSGSGKTTVVHHILNLAKKVGISTLRVRDYNILYAMFMRERESENTSTKFRPTEFGGFDILDYSVFDTALEVLENQVVEEANNTLTTSKLVTIEFARNNYQHALSRFNPIFFENSYFFFIDADMSTCIERIHKRMINPLLPEYHFLSDYIMKAYFNKVDWSYMSQSFQKEYGIDRERIMPYRNTGTLEDLHEQTRSFAERIFTREFAIIPFRDSL
jgi:thymidylate kinase